MLNSKLHNVNSNKKGLHKATQIQNIAHLGKLFSSTLGRHNCCYYIGDISLPLSVLLLQHLYLALFPRYYQFAMYVTTSDIHGKLVISRTLTTHDLEKTLTFENKA